jgi:hypothetical protein
MTDSEESIYYDENTYESPAEMDATIYASTRPSIEFRWENFDASFMTFEDFFQRYGEYGYDNGSEVETFGLPILSMLVNNAFYNLDTLPRLYDTLKWLEIIDNSTLTTFTFPNKLESFILHGGIISTLPPIPTTLTTLHLQDVNTPIVLSKLPNSITNLTLVRLKLDSLPTLPKDLEYLDCEQNKLTKLELPSRLKVLKCGLNKIKQLKLPKELVVLDSYVNPIEHLEIEHTQLEKLRVEKSPLLWSISEFPATLRVVRLSHNSLHNLPDSFYSKKYDALDISHNPWTDATLAKLNTYARRNNEKELLQKVLSMQKISDDLHHKFQTYKKSKTRVCASNSRLNDLIPNMQKYFAGSVRKTKKKKRVKSFFFD